MARTKLTIEDMHRIAQMRGGKCLSKEYINWETKLKWECSFGHIWKSQPYNVKHGTWCPVCANKKRAKPRRSIKDIQNIASRKRGICLSGNYENCYCLMRLQCLEGHIWETKARNILRGTWCPICAKKIRSEFRFLNKLTIKELQKIASKKDGKCLSEIYVNAHTKIAWQCSKGHIWDATPNSIKKGTWCPKCAQSKKKKASFNKLKLLVNNKGGKIKSGEYKGTKDKLTLECDKGHSWNAILDNILRGTWCPRCSKRKKFTLKDMNNLARKREGKCLSNKYINMKTKLLWECFRGHTWWAKPLHIKYSNSWCPTCAAQKIKKES